MLDGSGKCQLYYFLVPSFIVAYNNYMNRVDQMDQLCSINATRRKECYVEMTIFTFLLDIGINNAFSLCKKIEQEESAKIALHTFKQRIFTNLVHAYLTRKHKKKPNDASVINITSTS